MSVAAGTRIGPYEVIAAIGAGGMGEVYRARDTRLDRDVAVKVSATQFSERFTREARAIAALNHSNICHLYDVGPDYLVLELVEGVHPAGPMPFEDALPIIRQLIDGIEAAHEKNIIHRDLKSANIKITAYGVVKILDFGLAKAAEPEDTIDPAHSPTFTMGMTQAGVILGTAAYMAPEQARGKAADRRSDIWSFGIVVYELLVGRTPFEGETTVDILGAVVNKDPDWSAVPPRARRLLRWCLQKDRRKRLAAIGDARVLLDEDEIAAASPIVVPLRRRVLWPLATAVLLIASAAFAYGWWSATRPVARPLTQLSVDLGDTAERLGTLFALISPDGTRLIHPVRAPDGMAVPVLAVRRLDGTDPVILGKGSSPFWSPDSRSIAFVAGGSLMKVAAEGGVAVRLASAPGAVQGGSWSDGLIVVGTGAMGLFVVPEAGGTVRRLTSLEAGETTHRYPQVLPGGAAVVFTANASNTGFEDARIKVVSVATGQQKTIITRGYFARFVTSGRTRSLGHLLFMRGGALHAASFDADRSS